MRILAKFGLWLAFLAFVFVLVIRGKVTAQNRKWLLLTAVAIFGVVLGSDPNPMGTVTDAIVLLGGGWRTVRRTVLKVFPQEGTLGRIFPPEPA